ncbi:MAG: hypothetical protein EBZ12_08965, partial [Alphaproteobacteria bacterium]|nr:hypothetical protein [Alphaproteobacteria bacterium]
SFFADADHSLSIFSDQKTSSFFDLAASNSKVRITVGNKTHVSAKYFIARKKETLDIHFQITSDEPDDLDQQIP